MRGQQNLQESLRFVLGLLSAGSFLKKENTAAALTTGGGHLINFKPDYTEAKLFSCDSPLFN